MCSTLTLAQVILYDRRADPRAIFKVRRDQTTHHGLRSIPEDTCGFCFVEYYTHQEALDCMKYIGGTKLDERVIRTDLDAGFQEGRQYGRGKSGGQVRDEYRDEFDPGRGGYGRAIDAERRKEEEEYGSGR